VSRPDPSRADQIGAEHQASVPRTVREMASSSSAASKATLRRRPAQLRRWPAKPVPDPRGGAAPGHPARGGGRTGHRHPVEITIRRRPPCPRHPGAMAPGPSSRPTQPARPAAAAAAQPRNSHATPLEDRAVMQSPERGTRHRTGGRASELEADKLADGPRRRRHGRHRLA
jgi:hypothetical protein